jgi:hypothetical protein
MQKKVIFNKRLTEFIASKLVNLIQTNFKIFAIHYQSLKNRYD